MTSRIHALVAAVAALTVAACNGAAKSEPAEQQAPAAAEHPDLTRAREASARFQDLQVALAEGYEAEGGCVALPGTGAMGIHYVHKGRMGLEMRDGRIHGTDRALDPTQPELLIYEPQPDGTQRLVAIEFYTSQEAWGPGAKPKLFGVDFDTMADDPSTPAVDEGHMFTPHYDLHVWIWRENPKGTFAQWNPAVTCPADAGAPAHEAAH
jgi:hypothetical protein